MLCECCKKIEATIHLTQMVEGQSRELHLCEVCAEESGMNVQNVMSIPEILFGLGAAGDVANEGAKPEVHKTCPHCHMRDCDFKKTARLGCPRCYDAFSEELGPMLAAMHRGTQHAGKIPEYLRKLIENAVLVKDLKEQLEAAIRAEKFEEAASL
jgi:protein arginine kinase activator